MSRSMLALLLALGVTSASPVVLSNIVNSIECLAVNDVVTVLKASSATPFCSSYLSIGTSTVLTTQTITPSSLTASSTSLTTAPEVTATTTLPTSILLTVTETASTTPTVFTTVTTTSYSTYNCISGATTLPSTLISGTTPTGNAPAVKRTLSKSSTSTRSSVSATVPAYLSSWASSQISTACKCLGLTSATVTSTSRTTLSPGTVTTVTTGTISPTTTATVYSTSTQFTTTTVTTTLIATTSTVSNTLILPTPSGLSTGLNYYAYQNNYNYDNADPGFDATTFNSPNYGVNGFTPDVNLMKTYDYPASYSDCELPGQSSYISCAQVTVVMQGYFYAVYGAGTYTISTPNTIDNGLYFWDYETAFNDYDNSNVAYQAVRAGSSGYYGGSTTLTLAYGEVVPVTIMWVNGGGIGAASMSITGPNGNVYSSTAGFWIPADDYANCPNLASPFSP